jgi:hypothetical protein
MSSPSPAGKPAASQAAPPARRPVPRPRRTSGPAPRPPACRSRARRHSTVPGPPRGLCSQSRRSPRHARTRSGNAFRLPRTSSVVTGQYSPGRRPRHVRTSPHNGVLRPACGSRRRNGAHARVRRTTPRQPRPAGRVSRPRRRHRLIPRAKRPGLRRRPAARSQPGSTHNIPFRTLRLTAAKTQ